jgi:hypothetical protein
MSHTSGSSPTKPRGHPVFSDLPREIRLQIWNDALPDPRTVLIMVVSAMPAHLVRSPPVQPHDNKRASPFPNRLPAPTVLHVCQEARREALRFIRFVSCGDQSSNSDTSVAMNWWNPWKDTLYVPSRIATSPTRSIWFSPTHYPNLITAIDLEEASQARLSAVRHLAWGFEMGWLFWRREYWTKHGRKCWDWIDMARWLRTFIDLESFTWVVDNPRRPRDHDCNPTWIDHPEYSTRCSFFACVFPPSEIKGRLNEALKLIKSEERGDWQIPQVKVVIEKREMEEGLHSRAPDRYEN